MKAQKTIVRRDVLIKTISPSQFEWSFRKGLIWEIDGEFYSRLYEYRWVNPHMTPDADIVSGHYEVLQSQLVEL